MPVAVFMAAVVAVIVVAMILVTVVENLMGG